jgi:hypothetical protein
MARSIYNPQVLPQLQAVAPAARTWALLANAENVADVYHQFLLNPESLSWDRKATYSEGAIPGTSVQPYQYSHTSGKRYKVQVLLEAHWLGKSVQRSIDSLDALIVADPKAPVPTPKILVFAWGSRFIKPIVLTSMEVTEQGFLNGGEVSSATINLEFVEVPPSDADPTDRARLLEADRAKILKLTERQRVEGLAAADKYVKTNVFKAATRKADQQALREGNYILDIDYEGKVTLQLQSSAKIPLGKWYRNEFTPTKSTDQATGSAT